jgi:hypothetical protein
MVCTGCNMADRMQLGERRFLIWDAGEVANLPRDSIGPSPRRRGWQDRAPVKGGRGGGAGEERKRLETLGIANATKTLKVTAVVLGRPHRPRPTVTVTPGDLCRHKPRTEEWVRC